MRAALVASSLVSFARSSSSLDGATSSVGMLAAGVGELLRVTSFGDDLFWTKVRSSTSSKSGSGARFAKRAN